MTSDAASGRSVVASHEGGAWVKACPERGGIPRPTSLAMNLLVAGAAPRSSQVSVASTSQPKRCFERHVPRSFVAGVELAELAHDGHRDGAQLGGICRDPLGFAPHGRHREGKAAGSARATVNSVRGPRPARAGIANFWLELLAEFVEHLLEDLPVELLFRLEVPVDDQLGDATRGRHVLHGGVGES